MPDCPAPGQRVTGATLTFDEKLTVPWWWWLPGIGLAALVAAEVHLGYPGVRAWLPYLLTVPLAVAALVGMGRHHIRISGDELQVGPAHIALHHLGQVEAISATAKRRALGPDLDPAAYVQHKPWIGPLLRVELTDPRDPTPYWIFSVRRAEELAVLLRPGAGQADHAGAAEAERNGSTGSSPGR